MKNTKWAVCYLAATFLSVNAPALADGGMPVNPSLSHHEGVAASGAVVRTGTGELRIRIINSCFATNLRSVSNPLAPSSIIEAKIPLSIRKGDSSKSYSLWMKYPAAIVTAEGVTAQPTLPVDHSLYGGFDGMTAALYGNTVQLLVPANQLEVTLNEDGTQLSKVTSQISVGEPSFQQHITSCDGGPVYGSWGYSTFTPTYPCAAFMGHEGALSAKIVGISISQDQSAADIEVSFPGQTGFCGGFFSPLMLFFDEARPTFTGASDFPLSAAGKTSWVEKNAPGYFLVIDRNGNQKVDGKEELFGDQDSDKNGFEALKELDSNHDGVIDAKDKLWGKLWLWQDKNGDGTSQPAELTPLGQRVTRISLRYKAGARAYGAAAQVRQVGEFWIKGGKGKAKKGVAEDIWFAPIPATSRAP